MSTELVTVATFNLPTEAHVAKNYLEDAGIRAFLGNEEIVSAVWHMGGAVGGVKVQVGNDDSEQAVALLEECRRERRAILESDDEDEEEELPEVEQNAARALRAAMLGLLFFPLQYYAMWLIVRVTFSGEELSDSTQNKLLLAAVLCVPGGLIAALLLLAALH